MRWSICEGELLQVIAPARGIRRTEADPLEVLILGDVPLPLKIDTVESSEQAKPTPLELVAARGVVPACDRAHPGYWPLVSAMLPDVFPTADAAHKGLSRGQMSISVSPIDECPREPAKAKPHGARYAVPVLVDPGRRLEFAAILDLAPELPDRPDPPPAVSLPVAEIPAPVVDLPAAIPAEPAGQFLESIKGGDLAVAGFSPQYAREGGGFADNSEVSAALKATTAFAEVDKSRKWPTPSLRAEACAPADFLRSSGARGRPVGRLYRRYHAGRDDRMGPRPMARLRSHATGACRLGRDKPRASLQCARAAIRSLAGGHCMPPGRGGILARRAGGVVVIGPWPSNFFRP